MTTITVDNDGWIKEAIGIYYPNRSWGAFTQKPRQIVLHGTATPQGTAQAIANGWANTDGDASAHIIINKDGTFVQGLSLNWTAWANCCLTDNPNTGAQWDRRLPVGNQNYWSIAIEHCKDDPNYNGDVLTPAQQATSFALVQAICAYHAIPKQVVGIGDISQGGIIGHCNIDQLNRTYCPGPYPWQGLATYLQQNGGSMIPQGWHYNQQTGELTIPGNTFTVPKVIADCILAQQHWDSDDTPITVATQVTRLEMLNEGLGGGLQQFFKKHIVESSDGKTAFLQYAGQEELYIRELLTQALANNNTLNQQIATLNAQIKTLQQQVTPVPANITQATAALNALVTMGAQLKADGDTIASAAQNALTALGSH